MGELGAQGSSSLDDASKKHSRSYGLRMIAQDVQGKSVQEPHRTDCHLRESRNLNPTPCLKACFPIPVVRLARFSG